MSASSRILTLTQVELRRFLRDRSNIFFVFVLPLALVVFIGLQFGGTGGTQIGVVAGDGDAAAELVEELEAADGLRVVAVDDEDELRTLIGRANLAGGLVVPEDYEEAMRTGAPVEVGFVARPDPGSRSLINVVGAVLAQQSASVDAARAAAVEVDAPLEDLIPTAEQVGSGMATVELAIEQVGGDEALQEIDALGQFDLGASSQLFLFVFLTSLAGSGALIQTRNLGVATRILSTPTRLRTMVAGLAGGRLAIALFQALYIILVTAFAFQVDWGDPVATGVLVLVFSLVSAAAGMVLGALFRNDSQASGAGVGLGLVLAALGGSMMMLDFFPEGMRRVAMFTPHGWANTAMAEIVRRDAGVVDIATELGVLAAMAVGLGGLATWLLRRALTR